MYDIPSDSTITEVHVTAESVKEGKEPILVRDPDRAPRPRLGAAALKAQAGGKQDLM